MVSLQWKALLLIAMLAGSEAVRVTEAARINTAARDRKSMSRAGAPDKAEEAFQTLNQECKWSTTQWGCTGDGCAWRRLSNDWPPPLSQSCRHTDKYMLENNGAASLNTIAGVLHAKSVKYKNKCSGTITRDRLKLKCARRQQQMMRAIEFIGAAEARPELMNEVSAEEKVQQKQFYDASLSNVAGTIGEEGGLLLDLFQKMKEDPNTKRDPKAAVQKIMQLGIWLRLGREEEKAKATDAIKNFKAGSEMSTQESADVDKENAKLATELSSEQEDLAKVIKDVDAIAPDDLVDDANNDDVLGNGNSTSILQVRVSKGTVIGYTILIILLIVALVKSVIFVLMTIVSWAILALLGCGFASHLMTRFQGPEGDQKEDKKEGTKMGSWSAFGKCSLKVFSFPFVFIGKATVQAYSYLKGGNKASGSVLQLAMNSTRHIESLDSDKVVQGLIASADPVASQ